MATPRRPFLIIAALATPSSRASARLATGTPSEHVITANNQRLFRTAWSILKNRAEAEEAVQAAYLSAFAKIGGFEGRSSLSTWLTRIVVNEALGRRRSEERRRRQLEQEGVAVLDTTAKR